MPTKKTTKSVATKSPEKATKATRVAKVTKKIEKVATKKLPTKRPPAKAKVVQCTCTIRCAPEQAFWINNGPIVSTVAELQDALMEITDEQFKYHVNRNHNDFSRWVRECLNDAERALRLEGAASRSAAVKALKGACCK